MWQPGYREETVKRVRCKTEELTVPGLTSQCSVYVVYWFLKLLHTLQSYINVLIFSKWQKEEQNSSCITHQSTYFMNYYPSLYAFMSVILLHNILRLKTIKVWAVTKIRNSGARLHFLHSFMSPSKNVTKHCQQSSRYQPPSGWVSSSFLGVHDIYSYRTLKGHSWAVWNNLWSSTARSLFIHPEQIYQIFLQPTTGRGGKKKKQLWRWCSVLWKAAMNSLHKPSLEEEDFGRPWNSFYMHQQLSALLMNAHHVSHYQIPVDLLPGN